jgi:Dual OB-containing domain
MEIVLNHVTRMGAPRICVAGIDTATGRHVRPITARSEPITRSLLEQEGGPFGLGAVVDLGNVRASPSPPETEDHLFSIGSAKTVGQMDAAAYSQLLDRVATDDLQTIFGPELERRHRSFAVETGHGEVSLGVLRVQRASDLEIDVYGKLKLRLNDVEPSALLTVTDIRFVEADHKTLRPDLIRDAQRRLRDGVDLYLMVGLARPFKAGGDDRERHWLQVNGICLQDRPLGETP